MHNEEFQNFYPSPSIIRDIKSRWMSWAGYVAHMGQRGIHIGFWQESQQERHCYKDLDIGGRNISQWTSET
jgi:hypothetical protein